MSVFRSSYKIGLVFGFPNWHSVGIGLVLVWKFSESGITNFYRIGIREPFALVWVQNNVTCRLRVPKRGNAVFWPLTWSWPDTWPHIETVAHALDAWRAFESRLGRFSTIVDSRDGRMGHVRPPPPPPAVEGTNIPLSVPDWRGDFKRRWRYCRLRYKVSWCKNYD